MVPRKNGRRKNGPRKIGPRKHGPRENDPRKIGPRKNVLQKLFSVKRMLGNLNDFLHTPRCSTLTPRFFVSEFGFVFEFCVCCLVLGFQRLITSEHFTQTPRCSTLTPRFFVSVFWVCFRVLGLLSSFGFS